MGPYQPEIRLRVKTYCPKKGAKLFSVLTPEMFISWSNMFRYKTFKYRNISNIFFCHVASYKTVVLRLHSSFRPISPYAGIHCKIFLFHRAPSHRRRDGISILYVFPFHSHWNGQSTCLVLKRYTTYTTLSFSQCRNSSTVLQIL